MSFVEKEWMDAHQEELFRFLLKFQQKLVSGVNIKTINNTPILGKGNITIEGGSGGGGSESIYKATVTITELIGNSWAASVTEKLISLRANVGGNDSVLIPYDSNSGTTTTYVPAVVTENGNVFKLVFYYGDTYYTITGDSNDVYVVTKKEFVTASALQPAVSYFIETEEPGIYFTDQAGYIAMSYTENDGLDAAKVADNLMDIIKREVSNLDFDIVYND